MTPWGWLAVTCVVCTAVFGFGEWRHSAGVNEGELRGVTLGAAQQKKSDDDKQAALVAQNEAQIAQRTAQGIADALQDQTQLVAGKQAAEATAAAARDYIAKLRDKFAAGRAVVPAPTAAPVRTPDPAGELIACRADRDLAQADVIERDSALIDARLAIQIADAREIKWQAAFARLKPLYP